MPIDLCMTWGSRRRQSAPPKVGHPKRDRSKNKAQRRARKRTR